VVGATPSHVSAHGLRSHRFVRRPSRCRACQGPQDAGSRTWPGCAGSITASSTCTGCCSHCAGRVPGRPEHPDRIGGSSYGDRLDLTCALAALQPNVADSTRHFPAGKCDRTPPHQPSRRPGAMGS
jgi:hypothetical protein